MTGAEDHGESAAKDGTGTEADDWRPDTGRISAMLEAIAATGRDPRGGVSRLAYSAEERKAHDLVGGWLRELGLSCRQDAVGNTIAERAGENPRAPGIGTGSHLDSVPRGGRFDGVAGVVAAVEVMRILNEHGLRTHHPLRVVAFAAEEGARFGEPCIGSKAVAGLLEAADCVRARDLDGVTIAEAMRGTGLDPERLAEARWNAEDWAAFVELHVEQANVLETEDLALGLVDLVSGSTRMLLTARGQAQHSGSTPMALRADALTTAAAIVLLAEAVATDPRHRGTRATVGRLEVEPNSITTIPGTVRFTVDVRDVDSDRQRRTAAELVERGRQISARRGVELDVEVMADSSPAVLPMWLRQLNSEVCQRLGVPYRVMSSGASHDAQMVNRVAPAAMLFVPSKGGLSHVPEEWTSAADIAEGAHVLLHALLRIDGFLADLPLPGVDPEGSLGR
ncbi:MAG: hydantoinase/carbamoylase family amidase [Nitriliruptorales bacterium]|nr:hydantoinase/carbamoylase family amidase [Nitriliruptorales bacterium]